MALPLSSRHNSKNWVVILGIQTARSNFNRSQNELWNSWLIGRPQVRYADSGIKFRRKLVRGDTARLIYASLRDVAATKSRLRESRRCNFNASYQLSPGCVQSYGTLLADRISSLYCRVMEKKFVTISFEMYRPRDFKSNIITPEAVIDFTRSSNPYFRNKVGCSLLYQHPNLK